MDFELNLSYSIILFIISGLIIWVACSKLSAIVDYIDDEFGLGTAFGGTIMLAIVTNLPEIAITFNGAIKGNIDLAVGNILGGITIQSNLLVLFDFAGRKQQKPLSTLSSSETGILQGLFLVAILCVVIIGKQFPSDFIFSRTTPPEILILMLWLVSIWAMKKFQQKKSDVVKSKNKTNSKLTRTSSIFWLIIISIIVLVFGVILENTSSTIANHYKIDGVIFGATILALVTSLPEISGGLAFVKRNSYTPIIDDIFGGNAFLPCLFVPAIIITNNPILPSAKNTDIYLTSTAMIITLIYLIGMLIQNQKKYAGMGVDSWIALFTYLLSIIGLFFI